MGMPAARERRARSQSGSSSPKRSRSKRRKSDRGRLVLSVSNLSRNVNEDHLREIFSNYGKVKDATLAIDRVVGLPKGYAYVQYATEHDAERAIAHFHGAQIDGNIIKVEFQSDRRQRAKAERHAAENGHVGKEPPRKPEARRNGEIKQQTRGKNGNKDRHTGKEDESRRKDKRDEGKNPKESDKRPREKESKANTAKAKNKGREKDDKCIKATATSDRLKSKKSKPTSPVKKSNARKGSAKQATKAGSAKRKTADKGKASAKTRGDGVKARASSSSSVSSSSGASSSDSSKASSRSSTSSSPQRSTKRRRR